MNIFKNFTKMDLLESFISFAFGITGAILGLLFRPIYVPASPQNFAAVSFLISFVIGYIISNALSRYIKSRSK